jgi:hypothetical protein
MNTETQVKAEPANSTKKIIQRIISIVLVAIVVGCATRVFIAFSYRGDERAGFARGLAHGAMMPCALPNLLVGNDVTIYAINNTGRTYKLGYTMGVNGCGAIFFGIFFWRLSRWRKRAKARQN